ncbi:sigma-70 family RNA polymerase sigma factor [Aureispira anguillae]|uniref:Sigma-70 family RNA polymerase sigma factor n=1 Tax=Aureispira anguillae TaxID=2864201 RepID=A0A915YF99_9BACT|nr:sigma-70 family RNA polymerase sigma factor [Aureispira anguillae]BDS12053.1 sigma-70 family RNA polymerase sigma factor [Aureispira anguillae]
MKNECCNINEVVQEFYTYLESYVLTKTKDRFIAQDIVQEVMIKLIESHQQSREIKNLKAWLFQVSRNTIYDYYKNNKIELSGEEIEVGGDDPLSDFSKITVSDYIIPMIQLLPENYAVPLMWSDIENIPQKDIAQRMKIGLSAAKMRIQRGRNKLRELFIECCDIEYDKNGNFIACTVKPFCTPLKKIEKDIKGKLQ